jgi:hypothetical protein
MSAHVWHLVTRLGEAQLVLPVALLPAFDLMRRSESRPLAMGWMALVGLATLLTTASKVAFIGWGVGSAELNFTGVSGHAMFAASVYPVLLSLAAGPDSGRSLAVWAAAGAMVAVLVAASRVALGAHSPSEVIAGLLLGAAVSALALRLRRQPSVRVAPMVALLAALSMAATARATQPLPTHAAVTQLALLMSGHARAYTRADLLSKLQAP